MFRHVWDNFSRAWFMASWPMLLILLVLVATLFYQNEPGAPSVFGLKWPTNPLLFGVLQEALLESIKYIQRLFHWNKLRMVQNNKIVKSTYIWLAVVPIIAKFSSKLEDVISFNYQGKEYLIDITLPFSWQLFFFSSLCFVIGNVLYTWFSPDMIKNYIGFNDFTSSGRGFKHLIEQSIKEIRNSEDMGFKIQTTDKMTLVAGKKLYTDEEIEWKAKKLFWEIYDKNNESHPWARTICGAFYLIGMILFTLVIMDNMYWVFHQL